MSDAQLAIIGAYPPPYGGVATHAQRLSALLDARGISHVIYNGASATAHPPRVVSVFTKRTRWFLRYMLGSREPAAYLLSGRLGTWFIAALMARFRGTRVMIRARNRALVDWNREGGWRRWIAGWALRQMHGVVCVNPHIAEAALAMGVAPQRVHWSPGFLPPGDSVHDRDAVSPQVWEFLADRSPVIAANGKVAVYQGEDLYGLDMLVELARRLVPDHPKLGVVVCFWDHYPESDDEPLAGLQERAVSAGVGANILFNTTPGIFVPVVDAADVFVRPTNTDGDANSIREAAFLGVPAVASDCVERPAGARLFKSRDIDSFEREVRAALGDARSKGATNGGAAPGLSAEDRQRIDDYLQLVSDLATGATHGRSTDAPSSDADTPIE